MTNVQVEKLDVGFSVADAGYPSVSAMPSRLVLVFTDSRGKSVSVTFTGVPAYRWQESERALLPGEPFDGACEITQSSWLTEHLPGTTMYAGKGLRHLRFNFNAWGCLDVLCSGYSAQVDE